MDRYIYLSKIYGYSYIRVTLRVSMHYYVHLWAVCQAFYNVKIINEVNLYTLDIYRMTETGRRVIPQS